MKRRRAVRRRNFLNAVTISVGLLFTPTDVLGKTTVTTLAYNVDGALTAVTTQIDANPPETTYLTWDNFTPDAAAPSSGATSVGNGRLVGFGPAPGTTGLDSSFAFDPRDRLLSYSGETGTEIYEYHANSMLMSSAAGGDELSFYYDSSANPHVTNIHEADSGYWSAYLENNRYLTNGQEDILLQPRKDMAASYSADSEVLQTFESDIFGSSKDAGLTDAYDLRDNPFRFSGEYRTPISGAYYLRGRWYHPDLPVFLSRDPAVHLNRYSYGSGNPVMNTDPSGYSSKFLSGAGGFLRGADRKLNAGIGGHFARIFLAPVVGVIQVLAYPEAFWKAVKSNKNGIDAFLALGVVAEVGGGFIDAELAGAAVSIGRRYAARSAADVGLGATSGAMQGFARGFHHFDWNVFVDNIEYSVNASLFRGFTGANLRSSATLSGTDVARLAEQLEDAPGDTALVFRQKIKAPLGKVAGLLPKDSPFQKALGLGIYHEKLIAFTKEDLFENDLIRPGVRIRETEFDDFIGIKKHLTKLKGKFEFVGRVDDFNSDAGRGRFLSNPFNNNIDVNATSIGENSIKTRDFKVRKYGTFTNNCQHHAFGVLKDMGLR